MAEACWDVMIAGGGPAGCAAALGAAAHALRTVIVDVAPGARPAACAAWVGPAALRFCREQGVDPAAHGAEFNGVRLRSWDLKQASEVNGGELHGCIVDPEALRAALLEQAVARGVEVVRPAEMERVTLGEREARLALANGKALHGRVLVIADGAASHTARLANLGAARQTGGRAACALALLPPDGEPGLEVALGAQNGLKLAKIARGPRGTRVMLVTHDSTRPAEAQLRDFVAAAQKAGLLPAGVEGVHVPCLAGAALEMESHVSKRCLLVGDAGGFASAFSNEGLYPALRSGWLAAESIARAVKSAVFQDELLSFSAAWRADLADYLRMPSADLCLLMPMIFSNAQMAARVARAFLLGQPF